MPDVALISEASPRFTRTLSELCERILCRTVALVGSDRSALERSGLRRQSRVQKCSSRRRKLGRIRWRSRGFHNVGTRFVLRQTVSSNPMGLATAVAFRCPHFERSFVSTSPMPVFNTLTKIKGRLRGVALCRGGCSPRFDALEWLPVRRAIRGRGGSIGARQTTALFERRPADGACRSRGSKMRRRKMRRPLPAGR